MNFDADSSLVDIVIPASRFRLGSGTMKLWATLHSTQSPVGSGRAVARDFATIKLADPLPRSTMYIVDASEIIQCVRELDVADAAPPNAYQIAIEQVGYASQTWDEWLASGVPQQSSRLAADVLARNKLPAIFCDEEMLLGLIPGLTTHHRITKACALAKTRGLVNSPFYAAKNNHQDPDGNAPDGWDEIAFLGMVIDALPSGYAMSLR